jgi:pyruvate dehydrogenase (quinone)
VTASTILRRDRRRFTPYHRGEQLLGKTESTQSIPDFAYDKYADLLGLKGMVVRDPEQLGAAWEEALAADRPVVLNIYTDPNVPPLPPHISLKDAKNFMTMTLSEPELSSVLKNSAKEVLATILPSKS